MKPAKPMSLPIATAEQWETAFRSIEQTYNRNQSRRWVLICMRDTLRNMVQLEENNDD